MADVNYVNVSEGTKRVMNNTKLFAKLLGKFKEDKSIGELEVALNNGNIEKAQASVHTLKGIAANLSLPNLHKKCIEIESELKAGAVNPDNVSNVKDIHSQTVTEVDKVIAEYA
jgi:HPt (histidine-containing phosphotransfer) domain-containing protein